VISCHDAVFCQINHPSIFPNTVPLANIESSPGWDISCTINLIRILQRAIPGTKPNDKTRLFDRFYVCILTKKRAKVVETIYGLVSFGHCEMRELINYAGTKQVTIPYSRPALLVLMITLLLLRRTKHLLAESTVIVVAQRVSECAPKHA